ncbi:hypothetical protein [Hydrogenothermus marinus]|uniref:GGDEF domain-containing protein n=1 Tax=Hydrogenothermus marinus TaxID=133270 RepID=A0A3M0B9M2_9AQUI|nr:hypothetical protein [Hydrogenothermus marinus]RMA93184.1 hypothetical protein CLV39_1240 [Hydrogenothermus marinus]
MITEILFEDFSNFIKFEIEQIKRFQCPNGFCIMYVKPEFSKDFKKLKEILKEALRSSDVIASKDEHIFLILTGVDKQGADFVRKAIYDFFEGNVVEYYVDYPQDALTKDELIKKLTDDIYKKFGINLKHYFAK